MVAQRLTSPAYPAFPIVLCLLVGGTFLEFSFSFCANEQAMFGLCLCWNGWIGCFQDSNILPQCWAICPSNCSNRGSCQMVSSLQMDFSLAIDLVFFQLSFSPRANVIVLTDGKDVIVPVRILLINCILL